MASYEYSKAGLLIPNNIAGSKKPVFDEIATSRDGRDITRGYIDDNIIAPTQDSVLGTHFGNYSVYEDIARDDQVKSCRQHRELALTAKEWVVEPGDSSRKAKKAADRLKAVLGNFAFDDKTQKMLSAVLYGFSAAEVMWGTDGSEITISDIKVRNRARFGFLPSGELRLRTQHMQISGEPLPERKFWSFCCGADHDDEPYGLGLGHYLYWPVFFKKNGIKSWLYFLEKFGQPTVVGKYPLTASEPEKTKLLQALAAIQSDSAIRIPESMQVELLEAARSGVADYVTLVDRMNSAISKVYLGHTGSTDATPGRLGGESNASQVREDLIKADSDLVCGSFNMTVAKWLTFYNDGDGVAPPKVWRKVFPEEDLKAAVDRDKVLFDMGFKPTLKYVHDTYGDGYEQSEPVNQEPQGQPINDNPASPPQENSQSFSENTPSVPGDPTPISDLTDKLSKAAGSSIKSWVETIAQFVEKAESLDTLRDDLISAFGEMDSTELVNVMSLAFAAADLSGRFDVREE